MQSGFEVRAGVAFAVAIGAAMAVLLLAHSLEAALIALAGSAASTLIAFRTNEKSASPAAAPDPPDSVILDEVLGAIVEPVLLVHHGRVTLANAAARALLGDHIVGEDARIAIRHPAAAAQLAATAGPLPAHAVELVGLGALDQRWEMRVAQTSDSRRVVHLIDQTGNYAAERMRVDFVANASHELRTPLASILGFIETLGEEAGEDPMIRQRFLKVMFDEARRMQQLIEDLISLSRIEAEKYRAPGAAIDLVQLVNEVRSELRDAAGARTCDLVVDSEPELPPVSGDRVQLSQMLHNLIGNAMKYGRPGTPVTLHLDSEAGMVRVSVTDEGEGIASEHIPRLTERFYRVDAGRSRALGGTGLGLAIVKHIVERHRGRLDIVSVLSVGTRVTVVFPPAMSSKGNAGATIEGSDLPLHPPRGRW